MYSTNEPPQIRANIAMAFVLAGVLASSINNMLIKQVSGGYPLHEIVFLRSDVGALLSLILVQPEGGWRIPKTRRAMLHLMRRVLVITANMSYFVALAAIPLAEATAFFCAAPPFITVPSIPILGEKVGVMRMSAVAIGFAGVFIMQRPWAETESLQVSHLFLLLPVLG